MDCKVSVGEAVGVGVGVNCRMTVGEGVTVVGGLLVGDGVMDPEVGVAVARVSAVWTGSGVRVGDGVAVAELTGVGVLV